MSRESLGRKKIRKLSYQEKPNLAENCREGDVGKAR